MFKQVGPKKLTLCGGKRCCPTIELKDDNTVEIVDDFGGKVKMQLSQAELIIEALEVLKKD
jgi:hypothetical protein